MANKKVLIAYGTRFGCTQEVANEIALVMEKSGIEPNVVDLSSIKRAQWPTIAEYDGVLVGASIKIGKWKKEPRVFIENNLDVLRKHENKFGIFVCCGTAITEHQKAKKEYCEDYAAKFGIKVDLYDAFPGVFDLSKNSKMGFLDKKFAKMAKEDMQKKNIEFNDTMKNDYRNWDDIRGFAKKFARLVKQ
jgi:menaquinone-dependent protoporphyrinogen oxidase